MKSYVGTKLAARGPLLSEGDFVRGKIRFLSHELPESAADAAVAPARGFDVFCLPIIEWGFRFQRPQQLLLPFARDGHRVFYARTGFLGLDREPTLQPVQGIERIYEVGLPGEGFNELARTEDFYLRNGFSQIGARMRRALQ